jgi:hypothetical protein
MKLNGKQNRKAIFVMPFVHIEVVARRNTR